MTGKWRKNITYDKAPWFDFAVSDIQSVDYIEIQYRKDANHDPHRCGKDCRHGTGRLPLPAPPARASLRLFKIAPGDFVEPLDFVARLAALVTKPRVNLTRFHGVFAPNSKYRTEVTPAKRGKGSPSAEGVDRKPEQRHQAMTWAQRLKRVFDIDVSVCPKCGGETKVIACIENQAVID